METYNQLPLAMMLLNQGYDEDETAKEIVKGLQHIGVYSRYGVAHQIIDKAIEKLKELNK